MRIYSETDKYKLYGGDMREVLQTIPPNSVDSIVTDPPYELNFMGKGWDNSGVAFQKDTWEKCLRVLKPGGHLLAFGGSRTFHRIACAIEDAGFEIRDTIMWLYGCLSEDTQVLTKRGFLYFNEIQEGDEVRVYDIKNGIYKWEKPARWSVYKVDKDTCYRIKSNRTDQLVSRNHRCLVERDGRLVFEFAENLRSVERVPVLSYSIPYLQEEHRDILFPTMLWQDENLVKELFKQRNRKEKTVSGEGRREESFLERGSNLQKQERELFFSTNQVYKVSKRVYDNGEKRRVCDGASTFSCNSNRKTTNERRVRTPYQSQCGGQQDRELDVVCFKQGTQGLRKWKTYSTSLATITEQEYSGLIFCPTVSTGCFVARRGGKVFITGNSGFPKSMNIGLAVDKKNGVESPVVGQNQEILKKQAKDIRDGHRKIADSFDSGEPSRNNGFKTISADIREAQNEWGGWGTTLKPSYEPVIVARKPCDGTVTENVLKWGVGGINIDGCRIPMSSNEPDKRVGTDSVMHTKGESMWYGDSRYAGGDVQVYDNKGRFPANTILTYDDTDFEEVCGGFPYSKSSESISNFEKSNSGEIYGFANGGNIKSGVHFGDEGSSARYFYCAKATARDREEGCEALEDRFVAMSNQGKAELQRGNTEFQGADASNAVNAMNRVYKRKNTHPTVKPTSLMQYLIRLVTPKGGTVLDPFMGSGSTGKATMYENKDNDSNYKFIGVELTSEYLPVCKARIDFAIGDSTVVESPKSKVSETVSKDAEEKFVKTSFDFEV